MPSTVPPYFSSHFLAQRLTEELAVAQKKLEEYEDLSMFPSPITDCHPMIPSFEVVSLLL